MDNKDIELIQQMENKYDNFMPVLTDLIDSVEKFNSIYNNYMGSRAPTRNLYR